MSGRHCVALGVVVGSVAGDARGVFSLSCSRTVIASSAQKAWSVWCKRSFFWFLADARDSDIAVQQHMIGCTYQSAPTIGCVTVVRRCSALNPSTYSICISKAVLRAVGAGTRQSTSAA